MAKLSKQQQKLHKQAMELIDSDRPLTFEEKEFCFDNYHGDADSFKGAFFTPNGLAWDFSVDAVTHGSLLELCAGIGRLSFSVYHRHRPKRMVCVELCSEYVRIGKRLLPEAEWIQADVLTWKSNERFDLVISNPPFGKIQTSDIKDVNGYTGGEFEFKIISKAWDHSDYGVFLVPQGSAGFVYSGAHYYRPAESNKYKKWKEQTGLEATAGCGVDTSLWRDEWHGTNVLTEIITVEYPTRENAVECDTEASGDGSLSMFDI